VLDASGLLVREASLGPQTAGFHAVPDELLAELDPDVYRFEVDARVNDEALAATSLVNGIVEAAIPLGLEPQIAIGRMILPYAAVQEIRDAGPSL